MRQDRKGENFWLSRFRLGRDFNEKFRILIVYYVKTVSFWGKKCKLAENIMKKLAYYY